MISSRIHAMLLAGWLVAPGFACGQDTSDSTAFAEVGDTPVQHAELDYYLKRTFPKLDEEPKESADQIRRAAASVLAQRKLVAISLRLSGGSQVSDSVERAIKKWRQEVTRAGQTVEQFATSRGTTAEVLESEVTWDTLWNSYLESRITDDNLKRFFETRPDRYDGTKVDISQIFVRDRGRRDELAQIAKKITEGEIEFADAARKLSEAGSASRGGRIGPIAASGDVIADVSEAAFAAKDLGVQPIVESTLGLHLIYIHQKILGNIPFEELTDLSRLRRDAANYLFEFHARRVGKQLPIKWLDKSLAPPK